MYNAFSGNIINDELADSPGHANMQNVYTVLIRWPQVIHKDHNLENMECQSQKQCIHKYSLIPRPPTL